MSSETSCGEVAMSREVGNGFTETVNKASS